MVSDAATIELRSRVPADAAGRGLVDYLAARFRYHDADAWRVRIADGRVTVDGARVAPEHVLARGAVIGYRRPAAEPDAPTDLRIVHDDGGILVIDKPAGLPFHADGAFVTRTVVGLLARQLGARPRPVHRLDRETSGLCVLARDRATARALNDELAARGFDKTYDALVRGRVAEDRLRVELPIGRDPRSAVSIRRTAREPVDADDAATDVEVVARSAAATWVRCRPHTGRTHQIRVHLEALGHPLLGDKLYGHDDAGFLAWVRHVKGGGDAAFGDRFGAPRQMLHACRLAFTEPRSGRRVEFAAEPPADFAAAARQAGLPSSAAAVDDQKRIT